MSLLPPLWEDQAVLEVGCVGASLKGPSMRPDEKRHLRQRSVGEGRCQSDTGKSRVRHLRAGVAVKRTLRYRDRGWFTIACYRLWPLR